MNKSIILIAAAVILVLAGAGAFMVLNKSDENSKSNTSQNSNSNSEKSSITNLLSSKKNVKCDATFENGTGTVYIADKKMRGEFETTVNGETSVGHMIQDGEYTYTWSEETKQGAKFKTSVVDKQSSDSKNSVNTEEEADVNCSSWSVDNSKFTPPSNVTFTDLTSTINQVQDQSETIKQQQQAACEQVTDPSAKAACLQAIN